MGRRSNSSDKSPPHSRSKKAATLLAAWTDTPLIDEAQRRYLNYALSVITSRALPDVRDGLKPVQRRILYAMLHDLHLSPDAKFRKSAAVVGDVMGKYHPHGDVAIYDAMVRLAQDWVMRLPLVAGHGNFGSLDGDAAAAMRYTESKLRQASVDLLNELGRKTIDFRPNYDGTRFEPIVLPAKFPNLLVNGSQGIAVGMATSIPPHHLGEVIDACVAMIESPDLSTLKLLSYVKGPDFPTGGLLQATKKELEAIYSTGQGSLKLRGEWKSESDHRKSQIIITSIPYGVERKTIIEKIAEVILSKKLPTLIDVRDESTNDVRIVLETKRDADEQLIMAYLYKQTPLSTHVQFNLTCLVPTDNIEIAAPRRLSLQEILSEFLEFRYQTITRRTEFDLGELNKRIHILQGFETVFDALDELIRIIRKSEGKADAAKKIIARFQLSEEQTEAILELKLYRLAKLEILIIQKELAEKRTEAKRLEGLLKSESKRWTLVRDELLEMKSRYADKRRTKIVGSSNEPAFEESDFIVDENVNVILSAQGWVKRVREIRDLTTTRVREGDSVLAAVAGSTRSSVAFFSNLGGCYVARVHDIPQSSGYGDPVQKLFKLADAERMIAMLSFDPRVLSIPEPTESGEVEPPFAVAVTQQGLGFRFSLQNHRDPSTRAGRKFARLNEGDEVIFVNIANDTDYVCCASSDGHALSVQANDIALLTGVGKGSMVMKVDADARLIGVTLALNSRDRFTILTEKGKSITVDVKQVRGSRADKGSLLSKRERLARIETEVTAPAPLEAN